MSFELDVGFSGGVPAQRDALHPIGAQGADRVLGGILIRARDELQSLEIEHHERRTSRRIRWAISLYSLEGFTVANVFCGITRFDECFVIGHNFAFSVAPMAGLGSLVGKMYSAHSRISFKASVMFSAQIPAGS